MNKEFIAIIGIACRFPEANEYSQFWENLEQGVNSITEIPQQRWELEKYYSPNPEVPQTTISKWGGLMQSIDQFDAQFFGISPREAQRMDPQQRIMLELSWSCLEDAGYSPLELSGSNIGVLIGICNYDYDQLQHRDEANITGYGGTGTWTCMLPNRISSCFNFHGPSIPIDTACSSSLVAIHYAINGIKESECEMALVGGVSVCFIPTRYIQMSQLGMLSPTGQCKTFDSKADGYVRGEGAGVILLKPFERAIEDGDHIYGVIKGSAINHGGKARTLISPNVYAQAQVLRTAYTKADIAPNTVSYIETHGTGTPLGDPIEINALKRGFRQLHQQHRLAMSEKPYCGLGAVKTNIGHLEGAAGIAGMIKVLLAMKHRKLPKIVNFEQLNPRIELEESPFYIVRETQDWQQLKTQTGEVIPRRAGVSSFGIGGVNAHVVLEEAPAQVQSESSSDRQIYLLTLSAKTEKALDELISRYQNHLETHPELELADVCYTANVGRAHFNHRLAVIASEPQELIQKLQQHTTGEEVVGVFSGKLPKNSNPPKVAFLFTGQGSQYVNMGRELYKTVPTFRQALEQCEDLLRPYLEHRLLEVLYPQDAQNSSFSLLNQTAYTQPAVFAIEYALAKLWESWGVKPKVVMGHSVGEYVAATIAGVFSLEDGLKLIALRGQLMQQLPAGGGMVSLLASESQITEVIADYGSQVAIAAVNGPESVVISGVSAALTEICSKLEGMGIKTKPLQVSHAFHSPLMEPMLAEFAAVAQEVTYHQPRIPLISNVTGKLVTDEITTPEYWVSHIRKPVRFAQSMTTLQEQGYKLFLEIGSKPILLGMGRQCLLEDVAVWLPSLRPPKQEWQQMLESLGQLYVKGIKVNWSGFNQDYPHQKVALPTYPFQRQRYWLDIQDNGHKQVSNVFAKYHHDQTINFLTEEKDNYMFTKKPGETSRRREKIVADICQILAHELGFGEPSQVDIDNNLLELGADSLTLMAAGRKVEKNYGINITIRQLFEELTTVDALAEYIDANLSPEWGQQETSERHSPPQPEESPLPQLTQSTQTNLDLTSVVPETQGVSTAVERIMQQQLQIMSQQLAILQGNQLSGSNNGQALSGHSAEKVLHKPNQKGNLAGKPEITQPSTQLKQKVATVSFAHLSPSDYLRTPVEIKQQLNTILPELITQADLASYGKIPTELENLSVDYIVQALQEIGWFYQPTESFSTESAAQSLGVVSEQQRLFKRLLEILAEVGILQAKQQQWQVLQTLEGANPKEKSQRLLSQYPNAQTELTLLHRCASQLSGVLQGRLNPLQLVFPEGDLTTVTQLYQESPPAQVMNNLIQKAIAKALDKLPPNRGVRLLEIGAGTGGTTSYLLPHLNPHQTEYTFTDLGGFFNARAKEKFRDYPYVRYQTLDIEQKPTNQGFESQYYDVIIAANVLHATTSLSETLSHVRQLLAPGGMLVLWEKTTPQRWLDLIFGLLEGWQKFRDFELRPDSPLLSKSQWQQFLKERGFGEVVTLPQSEIIPEALSLETVIIAQVDTNEPKKRQSATRAPSKVPLNQQQQSYLEELIATYTKKTQKSQQMAQHYRPFLADKRATARWITELKEMRYPIVGESAHGSKIWDIDGNEYIDISLGFGVHLFGHNPQFITEAIQNWLKQGIQVGPQAKLAGEVAQLVHELTGMERVAFCNSGTEAMMTAVRLAHLTTGRDKIVMFTNSYHGHFDGVLAVAPTNLEKNLKATPISPGVLQNMVDDVIVLTYGAVESLDIIQAHAQELAAVLVEPVQSRRLDLQPKEFLQQLRQLTQQAGITLIFDEIITGFRIHPGGAQAWFGIEADIAAYGKCVGGGVPIGIVAGKANYMDGLDGGQWHYGDDSYPQKLQTFFGGTFNKNALTMATAKAVLEYLKKQGSSLQQNLNQRTSQLIARLNTYFKQEYLPVKMINFASLFQFVSSDNKSYTSQPIEVEVLVYHLIKKGLYIWEGRVCFLSTAHTDEDIDYIIAAVKESISEMRQGGFWQQQNQQELTSIKQPERVRGAL